MSYSCYLSFNRCIQFPRKRVYYVAQVNLPRSDIEGGGCAVHQTHQGGQFSPGIGAGSAPNQYVSDPVRRSLEHPIRFYFATFRLTTARGCVWRLDLHTFSHGTH